MGQIVDANPDTGANDDWALVNGTTVLNIIAAEHSYILSIQESHDYLVDITYGENGANCDTGSTYDPISDTFSAPPPDWRAVINSDLQAVHAALLQCLSDAANTDSTTISNAESDATSANSATFSTNEADLFTAICTWLSSGG